VRPGGGDPVGARLAIWRNRKARALVVQLVVLALLIATGVLIFRNTLANLRQRGIASGFGFLGNEAGFGIGETTAIPDPWSGSLPAFLLALMFGLIAVRLLRELAARFGRTVGDDVQLGLAMLVLLVAIPGGVLCADLAEVRSWTYDESASYGFALVTGFANTLKLAVLGVALATVVGFAVGIARLSSNWLIARLAGAYVETIRNLPLLVQIFFWYFAVIRTLPNVRESWRLWDAIVLSNRGLYLPAPVAQGALPWFVLAAASALAGGWLWARYARGQRHQRGRQLPVLGPALALLVVLPALAWLVAGAPLAFSHPELRGFNFTGGLRLTPEYAAMLLALTLYVGAYIAEIVRSGLQAVDAGQRDAAQALGLRPRQTMRLIVIPLALRVIIPPLTSQYLNLTKQTSLGVAIGYPELVSVGNTTINQSGQAIEVIGLVMSVYLVISLLISLFMNWYNRRVALIER
jgi:general L-amino acid transport system permease protein